MYITRGNFHRAFDNIKKTSLSHSTCKLIVFVSCLNVDALCASKVLTSALKKELIQFQVVPIVGYTDLKRHYEKLDDDISNIILLGCGAMVDLESFFEINPEDWLDELNRNEDGSFMTRRSIYIRSNEKIVEQYYSTGMTINISVSLQVYTLLSEIGETNIESLWLTIIGTISLDSQYPEVYRAAFDALKAEAGRLSPTDNTSKNADSSSLTVDKDYYLFLLRHWTLYDSFFYSNYVNAKLSIWREDGRKKLHKMFAHMGISLQDCKQNWMYMNSEIKNNLPETFKNVLGRYDLDELVRDGFLRTYGFRGSLSASECVEAVSALLEHDNVQKLEENDDDIDELIVKKEKVWISNFWQSWDALDNNMEHIHKGLEYAKQFQKVVFNTGMAVLEKRQLRNLKIYRLVVLADGPDVEMFRNPLLLTRLGNWILECCAEIDKTLLPLVMASLNEATDTYLVIGLAPRYPRGRRALEDLDQTTTMLNTFSVAFQQVAISTGAKVRIDSFESSIIEIRKEDLSPFLEKLTLSGLV
ncbi:Cell division control protein 45 [Cyberlindnera fabianii]|uniref:Cell division control protein 45 n=1 Tax=Cyberlindnera fabianii TaxID=36022 RepID=A0A1V2LB20_CYBFA|nr:Cell division control protein 45 [Cyberlindnera fabianii]